MFVSAQTGVLVGINGLPVFAEVHVSGGLPSFQLVGHVDSVCREARDRVRAAILSAKYQWPDTRITVNLAPSQQRKSGPGLDVAIAVAVLAAIDQLPAHQLDGRAFFGELGLDGSVRPIPGILSLVSACQAREVIVPTANVAEASLVDGKTVRGVSTLSQIVEALRADAPWPVDRSVPAEPPTPTAQPDLADVRGQEVARFALEVAAAGGHHLAFCGEPGAGKSMLARRLPGLLDDLDAQQSLLTTRIHSAAGIRLPAGALITRPPYRAPHHTATYAALVGGGSATTMRPGELSLATNGVLFLDELSEFSPMVLDTLRQPLEDGVIRISRAGRFAEFPCRMQLVVAYNPCACGMFRSSRPGAFCTCSEATRQRYARRLSGPLLDRFDLRVSLQRPSSDELLSARQSESTAQVRERVSVARERARRRQDVPNARLDERQTNALATANADVSLLVRAELDAGRLSARGVHRILRVAQTIADLRDAPVVEPQDVFVALGLRSSVDGDSTRGSAA